MWIDPLGLEWLGVFTVPRTFLHESWHCSHCLNHLPSKCESVPGALKDDLQDTNWQDSYIICGGTVQKAPGYSLRISSPLVRALLEHYTRSRAQLGEGLCESS